MRPPSHEFTEAVCRCCGAPRDEACYALFRIYVKCRRLPEAAVEFGGYPCQRCGYLLNKQDPTHYGKRDAEACDEPCHDTDALPHVLH